MKLKLGLLSAPRRASTAAGVFVALAVLIIGCGGGGGSSTSASSASGSSANGSSANGSSANGSSANGSTNTGTTSGIGTTGSTAGSGSLPSNVIFYTQLTGAAGGSYDLRYITPDGATDTALVAGIPGTVELVAINPNNGQYIFAAQSASGQNYGIYSNHTVSLTGATTLVPPTFNDVASLSVSQDGLNIVFLGALSATGDYFLYDLPSTGSLGAPIDTGNTSTMSPDNVTIAYSKFVGSDSQIILYNLTTHATTQITNSGTYNDYPQFSKDGTHLVYGVLRHDTVTNQSYYSLAYSNGSGSTVVEIPNPGELDERGGSLNSDATSVAFVGRASAATGLYTVSNPSGANQLTLKTSQLLSSAGVYWTTTLGRGIGSPTLQASRVFRKHKRP